MTQPVSFENLEIAFQYKSNSDLRRAFWLFRVINNNWLVRIGPPMTRAAMRMHLCGGETITECSKAIDLLARFGVGTILDYSGEGKESEADFERTYSEVMSTIDYAKNHKEISFCVFKVSGMARHHILQAVSEGKSLTASEQAEYDLSVKRVTSLCERSAGIGLRVFIDAEETWIQPAIDAMAEAMMERFNKERVIVYNTVQMYRVDRLQFLKNQVALAQSKGYKSGYKIVRGAYLEKERERAKNMGYPSPLQVVKSDSDRDYNEALTFCLEHIQNVAICAGTHNEASTRLLIDKMSEQGIPSSHPHVFFSQLYGMSDHLSFNLAKAGYQVAKYLPYGPVETVMPYLFRRAEENTAIAGQMGREFRMVCEEMARRKKA
jgi:proline dehydrogenase